MNDASHDLELALLTAPLPGEAPAGIDLRKDFSAVSPYYRLRDARAEAREQERRSDYDPDADSAPPAQWRAVRELAQRALAERTKDLEIAAWLTEALVRQIGVSGVTIGARIIAELVDRFWDAELFPLPDEDGIATRVAPITGLNGEGSDGTLLQPLRKQILFARSSGPPVSLWQYEQSEDLEKIGDPVRRKQRLAANVTPLDDLARAARAAGADHFVRLRADVRAALAAWTVMSEILDARAGQYAPPTSRVRNVLNAILDIANRYAPPEIAETNEPQPETAADLPKDADAMDVLSSDTVTVARTASREDMLRDLGRIAAYFRRTEPHSPLAYTLEEAVRRGRLTWPELLEEVVPDGSARSAILVMLGIRPPPPEA